MPVLSAITCKTRGRVTWAASAARPPVSRRPFAQRRRSKAKALDSSQTIAITQQLTSWAILVAGEGGWAWQRLKPDTPGRPSLPITGVIAGATIMVVALFQFEGSQSVAEIIGIVASAAAMAYYIKRCIDTTGSQSDWPGPKAPVAGMALVAFFALNICLQGLRG